MKIINLNEINFIFNKKIFNFGCVLQARADVNEKSGMPLLLGSLDKHCAEIGLQPAETEAFCMRISGWMP